MNTKFHGSLKAIFFPLLIGIMSFVLVSCSTNNKRREQADLYLRLGISHLEKGQLPQALKNLLKSEELNPRSPIVYNALGLAYFFRDREDLSEQNFLKSISLDAKATETRNNYARLLIKQKKYQKAHEQLKIAVADLTYAFPQKSYFNLGFLYFDTGKYEQALTAFEKAQDFAKDDCQIATFYGRAYLELKRYASANTALNKAVELCQPQLVDEPHYYSALTLYRMGEAQRAQDRFKEAYSLYPDGKFREKTRAMLDILQKVHQ